MTNHPMRPVIERRLRDIHATADHVSPESAIASLNALHADVGPFVEASKARLLATSLSWSDDQKADARWIYETNQRVAALCFQITEALRRQAGADDPRTLHGIAFTLLYMGEAMKWEIASGARAPRDYRVLHGLVRHAIATGRHLSPMRLDVGGRTRACTLESLYFRSLLLARFAGGNLSCAQIEILDEWLWMWAPILQGVAAPPTGRALRADLDSSVGLRQGPRDGDGPVLYLPLAPLEAAFVSLVAQFHSGRIVPAEGCTAVLRIEEHVAVLDLVRRGLRASRREPIERAIRRSANLKVEVHVGLTEIEQRGFLPPAPLAATIGLATTDGIAHGAARGERERDAAIGDIYDPLRRVVNLLDVSDSGMGFEGSDTACEPMAVGALVGVRLTAHGALLIGKVSRRMPTGKAGWVVIGVRRISSDARVVGVARNGGAAASELSMVYVRGDDRSGCEDAYLVAERTFEQGGTFEVLARKNTYGFRFNRVRERGRGWVLAGFEIIAARATAEAAA